MQREDDITPGRAALRDFKPAYVGSGSKRELAFFELMSAFTSCGHNAKSGFVSTVPERGHGMRPLRSFIDTNTTHITLGIRAAY